MGRLQGKTAIITGASRGLGAAMADRFAEEGAFVFLCDVLADRLANKVASIAERSRQAVALPLDVSSEAGWSEVLSTVMEQRGRIDVLVNNAGINDRGTVVGSTLQGWERTLAVNLTGPFLGMRAVAPLMREGGGGSIVNVCSLASHHGGPYAAYGASKWGLRGLTQSAAMEFAGWHIRVNSVSPAVVETELNSGQPYLRTMARMTPMGRNGMAIEIANGALFLASDEASFVTGQDVALDGGFTAGAASRRAEGAGMEA